MHSAIQHWIDAERSVDRARKLADQLLESARCVPPPENLRPAAAEDITPGAIIWYPVEDATTSHAWVRVGTIHNLGDEEMAFVAHDGKHYWLEGAFVEQEAAES